MCRKEDYPYKMEEIRKDTLKKIGEGDYISKQKQNVRSFELHARFIDGLIFPTRECILQCLQFYNEEFRTKY